MQLVLERCTVRPWHPHTIQDAHEFLQRAISEQPEMKFCIEIDGTDGQVLDSLLYAGSSSAVQADDLLVY